MSLDQIILWFVAIGFVLGGIDKILGGRFGLAPKFEEGFHAMGTLALGMVGIICLTPLIIDTLGAAITPLFTAIGVDPGMFGSILANDMGGYPLAMELAIDERAGLLGGAIVASMFGVILVFHIPVGLGLIPKEKHPWFAQGLLIGFIVTPIGSILGGLIAGFPLTFILRNMVPIIVISVLLAIGLRLAPNAMVKGSLWFGRAVTALIYFGLICAGFETITGVTILPGMTPISEAMQTVGHIGVILAGTFPVLFILLRVLDRPLKAVGRHLGLDSNATAGLIFALANSVPVFTMIKDMDRKATIINTVWAITVGAALGDHLGYTAGVRPDMIVPMIVAKVSAGICGVAIVMVQEWLRGKKQVKISG